MMQKSLRFLLLGVLLVSSFVYLSAAEKPKDAGEIGSVLLKTDVTPAMSTYVVMNINNWTYWTRKDGQGAHTNSGNAGGFYPAGTSTVIYQDNIVWGGVCYTDAAKTVKAYSPHPTHATNPTNGVRIGGGTYNQGTKVGRILGSGATAVRDTANYYRVWKIRRDIYNANADQLKAILTKESSDIRLLPAESISDADRQEVLDSLNYCWSHWADIVAMGAPWVERNGVAGYQPPPAMTATFTADSLKAGNYDEPGVCGSDPNSPADMVIWTVYNDIDRATVNGFEGSLPIGIEVKRTIWGYSSQSEMGHIFFTRYQLTNKGGGIPTSNTAVRGQLYIDSMFVCAWSDPDVGDSGDDLDGCDTTLSLGYTYNGQGRDVEYVKFKLPPPAIGYDFLAGPVITAAGDSGVIDFKRVYNQKNLGMSSFAFFSAGSSISDPPFTAEGGQQWWRLLRGYVPDATGQALRYYPFPPGVTENRFPLSGDPVAGTGFLDGLGISPYSLTAGDRRLLVNTGPFTLDSMQTQEIYVGTVAGLGADRFSSISAMKHNDLAVQNTFNGLFKVPLAPKTPTVTASELDEHVVVEWGADVAKVAEIEATLSNPGDFQFEGYKVYQLPTLSSLLSAGKVVFDVDIFNIYGSNTKISRNFNFTQDYIRDIPRLQNGQEYYLAVTAYAVSHIPGYVPAMLESEPWRKMVQPQKEMLGTRHGSDYETAISATHTAGIAKATMDIHVVDPKKLTGDTYEIRIAHTDSITDASSGLKFPNQKWQLFNVTKNVVTMPLTSTYGINTTNPIYDGFQIGFNGVPFYVAAKEIAEFQAPSTFSFVAGYGPFDGITYDLGYGPMMGDNFYGSTIMPWNVKANVEIRFDTTGFNKAAGTGASKAYRYLRGAATGSSPYTGFFPQPFSVWNITDEANPTQIDFAFLDATGSAFNDSIFAPGNSSGDREYFWIIDDAYTATAKTKYTGTTVAGIFPTLPVLYNSWPVRRTSGVPAYKHGDRIRIYAQGLYLLTGTDVWQFSTADAMVKFSVDNAKVDVNRINVYPNPYYAINTAEVSRFNRFVTFIGLPSGALTVRIFNLAGQLVRTLTKGADNNQFLKWDLTNASNFPVASGMYIAYIEMPDIGGGTSATKILKVAVIQEQEVLDTY